MRKTHYILVYCTSRAHWMVFFAYRFSCFFTSVHDAPEIRRTCFLRRTCRSVLREHQVVELSHVFGWSRSVLEPALRRDSGKDAVRGAGAEDEDDDNCRLHVFFSRRFQLHLGVERTVRFYCILGSAPYATSKELFDMLNCMSICYALR